VSIVEKSERNETSPAEGRLFAPAPGFAGKVNASSSAIYRQVERDRLGFREEMARLWDWFTPWTTPPDWQQYAQWSVSGRINVARN